MWTCLFSTSFVNLKILYLSLSCTDGILQLIPIYCPNLVKLCATCIFERINNQGNAMSFLSSISDVGLGHLSKCLKLKQLTVNDPRSNGRGITHNGLRKILRDVDTLEDITYNDLGAVIANNMKSCEKLNLRVIRHFNATPLTIKEILRLCKNLIKLQLTFFNISEEKVITEIIANTVRLKVIDFNNLTFGIHFSPFFKQFGEELLHVLMENINEPTSFDNLVTVARYCPNLKKLHFGNMSNRHEIIIRPVKNLNHFRCLESLSILGRYIDLKQVLLFSTQNSSNLKYLKFIERNITHLNVDSFFVENINLKNIEQIELSSKLQFTKEGLRLFIDKYATLQYLKANCDEDCYDVVNQYQHEHSNYSFQFVNVNDVALVMPH